MVSLLQVFRENAKAFPHNDFLIEDRDSILTYQQAVSIVEQLVGPRLESLRHTLSHDDANARAVILAPNSTLFILSILALWCNGLSASPISSTAEPHLWSGMIGIIDPAIILVAPGLAQPLLESLTVEPSHAHYADRIIDLASLIPPEYLHNLDLAARASPFIPPLLRWLNSFTVHDDTGTSRPSPGSVALTLFTSSAVDWSTLKSISYTHEILFRSSERTMTMLGGSAYCQVPKKHLGWLPLSHCFEFCITFCGIILRTAGAYIFFDRYVTSPETPSMPIASCLLEALSYHEAVTSMTMIPAVCVEVSTACTQDQLPLLRRLHSLGVGGAQTPESLFRWATFIGIHFFDCSGATEMAGTICIRCTWDPEQRNHGLRVIPGLMGILVKEQDSDPHGELVIRGKDLPSGYDKRESRSFSFDQATGITTYFTGDIYSHRPERRAPSYLRHQEMPTYSPQAPCLTGLTYVGRIDDTVVLSSGLKIDAPALENVLNSQSGVLRSAIIANKPADALLALVEMNPSSSTNPEYIIPSVLQVNTLLPFEKRIRRENILIVRAIPTTTKGAINRKLLKKRLSQALNDTEMHRLFDACADSSLPTSTSNENINTSTIRSRVIEIISRVLSLQPGYLSHNTKLAEVPLNSLSSTLLAKALQDEFGVMLNAARLYGLQSVDDICNFLVADHRTEPGRYHNHPPQHASDPVPNSIVITGAACRLAGGIDGLDSFWSSLLGPEVFIRNCSQKRPDSRWPGDHPQEKMMYPSYWLDDGVINNVGALARFFRLSPKEVQAMSPNARLVLQLGYQALEDAGVAPHSLSGSSWGVFSSVNDGGWKERRYEENNLQDYSLGLHGSADDAVGARLAYFLNLTGPAVEIKTACSSSAVALHTARLAIQDGDCEAALVVSATTHFHPSSAIFRSSNGIVSPSGRCNPFADMADGFVTSEGAVAIVLQKSEGALVHPYAIIRATGVGQNGASHGFYAPNLEAQKRLLRTTLAKAGCTPGNVSLIEAHGTGTQLGDAIELQALADVFDVDRPGPLYVSSAKAVVGHTEECAGLVGVLKTMLCLAHSVIPSQPISGMLNRVLDTPSSNIVIPSRIWPLISMPGKPTLACVSSFGLSGTLASVVLQAAGPLPLWHSTTLASVNIFLITASSHGDFIAQTTNYVRFLREQRHTEEALQSICRTTQIGRDHFHIRRGFTVNGWSELLSAMRCLIDHPSLPSPIAQPPKVGLWFGLPTSDQTNNQHPYFLAKLREVSRLQWLHQYTSLQKQLALARCLQDLGISIHAVGGEGMTELLAAVFAGLIPPSSVFRLADSNAQPSVLVEGSRPSIEEELLRWRPDELSMFGQLDEHIFILRGNQTAISSLIQAENIVVRHPPLLPTIPAPLTFALPPKIHIVSAHLCEILGEQIVTNTNYWHGVQDRSIDRPKALVEMSRHCDIVVCLGSGDETMDGALVSLGDSLERIIVALFEKGCSIAWDRFAENGPRLSHLPSYPLVES